MVLDPGRYLAAWRNRYLLDRDRGRICGESLYGSEKAAIVDQGGKRSTSYRELADISARLASWLLQKGIGREKLVAIRVPRGAAFIACRFSFGAAEVSEAASRLHLSVNGFYLSASALSMMAYEHTQKVMLSWTFNGRADLKAMRTVGLLIRETGSSSGWNRK